jgi:hypothetical protein
VTRITADRADIVTPGSVVTLRKDGLLMHAVSSPIPPSNTYKNGKISQSWVGRGKDLMIGITTPGGGPTNNYPRRQFAANEKCWVTGIQVEGEGISFQLYSDPYEGIRYHAILIIPFPDKKTLPPADAAMQLVDEVLAVVPPADENHIPPQPHPVPAVSQETPPFGFYFLKETGAHLHLMQDGSFILLSASGESKPGHFTIAGDTLTLTYQATGRTSIFKIDGDRLIANTGVAWIRQSNVPPPVPADAPTPPPPPRQNDITPPSPAPTVTVSLGQTKEKVIAAFGEPGRKAVVGHKEIFFYKDMKVTFTNGKVSNVE